MRQFRLGVAVGAALACTTVLGAWTPAGQVTELEVNSGTSGGLIIAHSAGINPNGCSDPARVSIAVSDPMFSSVHAVILAAYSAGSSVEIDIADNDCSTAGMPLLKGARLSSDLVVQEPASSSGPRVQRFLTTGTFSVPAGVSTVLVTMCGGGGGGSGGVNGPWDGVGYTGRPGGSSYTLYRHSVSVISGEVVPVTVGAGGAGGVGDSVADNSYSPPSAGNGGDGQPSSFGALSVPGGGGAIAGRTLNKDDGVNGNNVYGDVPDAIFAAGFVRTGSSGAFGMPGETSSQPCSGGGGGGSGSDQDWSSGDVPAGRGGAGSSGFVMVEW